MNGLFSLEINCSSDVNLAMYLPEADTGSLIADHEMESEERESIHPRRDPKS